MGIETLMKKRQQVARDERHSSLKRADNRGMTGKEEKKDYPGVCRALRV